MGSVFSCCPTPSARAMTTVDVLKHLAEEEDDMALNLNHVQSHRSSLPSGVDRSSSDSAYRPRSPSGDSLRFLDGPSLRKGFESTV
ncbi:hypothetical protein GEMRC1_004373 [Eukaryota sp. GEM-RC1]